MSALRWLGAPSLVQALVPVGRAPLFLGAIGAHVVYSLVQMLPGGRGPVWIPRPPNEGWSLALGLAMLCAILAGAPITPGGHNDILLSSPFAVIASAFFIERGRRVQRWLVAST